MSDQGVSALRAERDEVLSVVSSLTPEEWQAPSDCEGWRVQDVVAHMANVCRTVVDPGSLVPGVAGDLEATQSVQAEAHRDWPAERVLDDYRDVSGAALEALHGLQAPGVGETVIPIYNAGQYPLHIVANATAFDHFCHLRNDILRPNGPIDRRVTPVDDVRVAAALEWLLAGLPQMSPEVARALTRPVALRLTGPGGGEWTLRASDGVASVEEGADADTAVVSPATEFIIWSTRRRPWRERDVEVTGDREHASAVLDAVHLF